MRITIEPRPGEAHALPDVSREIRGIDGVSNLHRQNGHIVGTMTSDARSEVAALIGDRFRVSNQPMHGSWEPRYEEH